MTGIFLAACGGGDTGSGGGEGGTTTTTTTTSSTTTSSTTTTTSSTSSTETVPGCAGAQTFEPGEAIIGDLAKEKQEDYYKFTGTKGQVLYIDVDAQDVDGVVFDPTYIDTVVTLVDENENKIAQNNDPSQFSTADSRLYTILPADGTYCVRVAECHTVFPNQPSKCSSDAVPVNTYYELSVFELFDDGPGDGNTADPEAGNDPASASEVDWVSDGQGSYYTAFMWGFYDSDTDLDYYTFTMPADVDVPLGSRAQTSINAFPAGPSESGSTMETGELWVVDPAAPDLPFARIDPTKSLDMGVPLELDKEYWLVVNRPADTASTNDFYLVTAFPGWGNPVETDDLANTVFATAEVANFSDADSAFVAGDLIPFTDVDHFKVDVPAGMTTVTGVCGARTNGSGLLQLKITLLGDDGLALGGAASDIETASNVAYVQDKPIGANTSVVLKVEAGSQSPETVSSYYQCGIHFQ